MLTLIKKLRELTGSHFTGRVHLVERHNARHIGVVLLREGFLVNGRYRGEEGLGGLGELILVDETYGSGTFRYLAEPEVIARGDEKFAISLRDFLLLMKDKYYNSDHLRPPCNLKILVKKDFSPRGEPITPMECDLLETISDGVSVGEVYKNAHLIEPVMTSLLVSLRRKGALKVIG